MSERTQIQWADSTWNPWIGCSKVSPGCANCYAEVSMPARMLGINWGPGKTRRAASDETWAAPFTWNQKPWVCNRCGVMLSKPQGHVQPGTERPCAYDEDAIQAVSNFHRRRVFAISLGDWLDFEVPTELFIRFLDTVRRCTDLHWILCTKRPALFVPRLLKAVKECETTSDVGRWAERWAVSGYVPFNVCVLASVESQTWADERVPDLLQIPARWHGLSLEPLLEPVHLPIKWMNDECDESGRVERPKLDWLVIGGESGKQARPCDVEWIKNAMRQGQEAGVAVFVKQLGSEPTSGKITAMNYQWLKDVRHPKGGDPAEWPADMRVRQWPEGL